MAKYQALKRGFDGNKIIELGEEFEFDGPPGMWMKPLDKAAEAKMAAYVEARKKRKAELEKLAKEQD